MRERTRAAAAGEESLVRAWSLVWAGALLIAITAYPGWYGWVARSLPAPAAVLEIAIVLVALAIVAHPMALVGLATFAILQLGEAALALPELPNHRWIVSLLNLCLIASLLGGFTFRSFQAAGRAIVVICYVFATFAKLNADFLDPSTSCAAEFYGHVAEWLPLPDGAAMRNAVVYSTFAVEGLLPLGLVVARGRARVLVVVAGILFHFVLALDLGKHFVNFSVVMTAALLLFLPAASLTTLGSQLRRGRSALVVGSIVLAGLGFTDALVQPLSVTFFSWRHLIYTLPVIAITVLLLRLPPHEEAPPLRPSLLGAAVIAIALLNGLSPYLGLKTRTAFDMYSNLRLEAERSNHLVVPRSLDVLGLLGDRVHVLRSDARGHGLGLESGATWPWFEVSRRLAERPPPLVVYERGGERYVHDGESHVAPPPWLLRKLLIFRPLGEGTGGLCIW